MGRAIVCAECGADYTPKTQGLHDRRFCCRECYTAFRNRTVLRGRIFYDLIMIMRYDRANFGRARKILWNLCRAARDADKHARQGRRSWRSIEEVEKLIPAAYGQSGDGR